MPYTFNGCGTRFYGKRERAEDGSYITTEWITFVYVPVVPIRSYRVLPVGKGTNLIVHSSQNYQTVRVPLCWAQVRNVYFFASPIILLVLYAFDWSGVETWVREDVLKLSTPKSGVQMEAPQEQPAEADLPLNSKEAAVACGKVLKLDKAAFGKLDLLPRLAQLAPDSGFTDEELKDKDLFSAEDLSDQAFSAYSLAYLTWDKPTGASRADFDGMVVKAVHAADNEDLSPSDRAKVDAYMIKFKKMMLKAFDLGRRDAKASPCPF